jgi:hypothetical protein
MTEHDKRSIATSFIQSLRTRDASLLTSIVHEDVIWSLPGANRVSGEAAGVAGIMARANDFAKYSLNIEILYVLIGHSDVALSLHNTGTHNGRVLDEHLTTVVRLDGTKVRRLDTYISDVPMLDAFFA